MQSFRFEWSLWIETFDYTDYIRLIQDFLQFLWSSSTNEPILRSHFLLCTAKHRHDAHANCMHLKQGGMYVVLNMTARCYSNFILTHIQQQISKTVNHVDVWHEDKTLESWS